MREGDSTSLREFIVEWEAMDCNEPKEREKSGFRNVPSHKHILNFNMDKKVHFQSFLCIVTSMQVKWKQGGYILYRPRRRPFFLDKMPFDVMHNSTKVHCILMEQGINIDISITIAQKLLLLYVKCCVSTALLSSKIAFEVIYINFIRM